MKKIGGFVLILAALLCCTSLFIRYTAQNTNVPVRYLDYTFTLGADLSALQTQRWLCRREYNGKFAYDPEFREYHCSHAGKSILVNLTFYDSRLFKVSISSRMDKSGFLAGGIPEEFREDAHVTDLEDGTYKHFDYAYSSRLSITTADTVIRSTYEVEYHHLWQVRLFKTIKRHL